MDRNVEVAVVGATGVVGRQLLSALHERGHPSERISALASERSAGEEVDFGNETLEVERATADAFRGKRLVFMATPPDVARPLALAAQAAGAWVVDVGAAFFEDAAVPLVLPSVNAQRLKAPFNGRIVRCPPAVSSALLTVLDPLRTAFGLGHTVVTALLSASSMGRRGVSALESQTAGLVAGRDLEEGPFPHRLAFNVIPQVGLFRGQSTEEEQTWAADAATLWGDAGARQLISGTALQSPHFFGHVLSLCVTLQRDATEDAVRAALRASPGLKLLDVPQERIYPMPLLVADDASVLVGRLRAVPGAPRRFLAVAVIDNAGRGAALNALEVGELLL